MAKKLPPNLKKVLDTEVRRIAANPYKGDRKKGTLRNVRDVLVEKSQAVNDQWLLAYRVDEERRAVQLLAFGQYENFCRDLGRHVHGGRA